jgi:hypothetical protein
MLWIILKFLTVFDIFLRYFSQGPPATGPGCGGLWACEHRHEFIFNNIVFGVAVSSVSKCLTLLSALWLYSKYSNENKREVLLAIVLYQ